MRSREFIGNDILYLQKVDSSSEGSDGDEIPVKKSSKDSLNSEKSYSPVVTKKVLLEKLTFLTFNLKWMFWVSLNHCAFFTIITYEEVFEATPQEPAYTLIAKFIANSIYLVDIVSAAIHLFSKDVSKRIYEKRNRVILMIDVLSLLFTSMMAAPMLHPYLAMRIVEILFVLFRLHRAASYYLQPLFTWGIILVEISRAAGFNNVGVLLRKYGMLFFLCVHLFSLVWQSLNCYNEINKGNCWSDNIDEFIPVKRPKPYQWYIISMYCIMGSFASLSLGMEHAYENNEALLGIAIMLVGLSVMNGVFLGAFTSVQSDAYRRHAQFADRYKLINASLTHKRLSKRLKRKILQYYISFWRQQGAIKKSRLFDSLPSSIQKQALLDKYWHALNQSHIFRNVHDAYKRAIASVMQTEIFAQGEAIFYQGKENNKMYYIARGTVQILSGNDGESPILTLDMGTVLGEVNLMYTITSPCQVIASSFCIVHFLDKRDMWRITLDYRKLKPAKKLHKIFQGKIDNALDKEDKKGVENVIDDKPADLETSEKALKKIKHQIFSEKGKSSDKMDQNSKKGKFYISGGALADLYIVSKQQTALRHTDEICFSTTWPWILQPNSSLLTFWETIVVITVLFVSITYPYYICFERGFTDFMLLAMVVIDIVYALDIVLQLFTSMESEHGIISKLTKIFAMRIRSLSFILDLLAAFPVGIVCNFTHITKDERILTVAQVNRIFKIHKIIKFFGKLENSFKFNLALVRGIKYVLSLIFMTYFIGSLYYMIACFYPQCSGWYLVLIEADLSTGGLRSTNPFEVSLYFSMMVVSQSGYGRIYAYTYPEMVVLMIFFIMGVLTFSYLVSDYSATLMLANRSFNIYIQTVGTIRKFMVTNRMTVSLINRTNEYLASQWRHKKGMLTWDLLHDAPTYLYEEQQAAKYALAFATVPLFQELEVNCLNGLAAKCMTLLLPPNEIVVYAGEISKEMFIIERGYCEVISAISGKLEKILVPGQHFYAFEMLLEQPGIFNIRTLTHVRFIKISYQHIKSVLTFYPEVNEDILRLVNEMKQSLTVQRLFMRSRTVAYQELVEEASESWFIFPRRKLNPRNIDYLRVFANMGIWKIFKVFLMRRTILPYGKFICIWEMFRGFIAFLSGMIYPALLIHQTYYPSIKYYVFILDAVGVIDIYIRLHVCYYNDKGILVTHPKCTAIHYLCHSFMVDLISVAPLDLMLKLIYSIDLTNKAESESKFYVWQAYFRYPKLLQLYRLPDAFAIFKRDLFQPPGVALTTMKYVLFSLVLFNALANILILISYTIVQEDEYFTIVPIPNTWLNMGDTEFSFDLYNALNIYITAYYWMAASSLSINFGDLVAIERTEMYFVMLCIIAGYLLFTYIFVIISSCKATINVNLTLYQQHMKHLIDFMKRENIPKVLQKKAIDHFEYIWKRTHGMRASHVLKQCHPALQEDCVLCLYEQTLAQVPMFADLNKSFYRLIGTHLEEAYFLRDSTIIKLNDIINFMYIIHKGEVSIKGPDGSLVVVLTVGCMFGNLDDVRHSRSMVTVIATKAVDLLLISTDNLYSLIKEYPVVQTRLRKHILLENMFYVNKKTAGDSDHSGSHEKLELEKIKKRSRLEKIVFTRTLDLPMMLISYASCVIVTYHAAFQNHHFMVISLSYIFDAFHLIKLYTNFFTPYIDNMGELVTDKKLIKKRIFRLPRFYIEVFAIIPFEIFAVFAPRNKVWYWISMLKLTKLLRWWNISTYFDLTCDYLNVNILLVRLGTILIYFSLLLHLGACVLYMAACWAGVCKPYNWIMHADGVQKCNYHYICSFFFVTSIITFTGYGDVIPRSLSDVVVVTLIIIMGKYTTATFVGDMSSIVYSMTSTLVNYDHSMKKLKEFLRNGYISGPLRKIVVRYSHQLWTFNKGVQLPHLLSEAPSFLIEDLKQEAYGRHLLDNYIFKNCHKDFIRLLIAKFQVKTFFAGDLICQQGDINNTMFFVHKGVIDVFAISEREEEQVDQLKELDCFGMVQGLFPYCPHTHTYIAVSVTIILTLTLSDWLILLKFYPAARFDIYRKIQRI